MKIAGFAGGDRTSLDLPANQEKLLASLLVSGKPVVVVLLNGSALAINTAAERANAILEAWYPGQQGGLAIARTLAGDNNPAGRLPVTFYRSVTDLPPFEDYSMKGRTYRYFTGTPLFPFGYGLSYSKFEYADAPSAEPSTIRKTVKNVSTREGDEVVQLYRRKPDGLPELQGFRRIHLKAGETATVEFSIPKETGTTGKWYVGGGQPPRT